MENFIKRTLAPSHAEPTLLVRYSTSYAQNSSPQVSSSCAENRTAPNQTHYKSQNETTLNNGIAVHPQGRKQAHQEFRKQMSKDLKYK